jgi:phosphonate transport system substrate-binding protein
VSIYKSERFPPATIGYAYNVTPQLRDGIRETLLKFDWKGTGLEKQFGPAGQVKFVPVNYKDDWANTRRIDQVIAEARKGTTPAKGT